MIRKSKTWVFPLQNKHLIDTNCVGLTKESRKNIPYIPMIYFMPWLILYNIIIRVFYPQPKSNFNKHYFAIKINILCVCTRKVKKREKKQCCHDTFIRWNLFNLWSSLVSSRTKHIISCHVYVVVVISGGDAYGMCAVFLFTFLLDGVVVALMSIIIMFHVIYTPLLSTPGCPALMPLTQII